MEERNLIVIGTTAGIGKSWLLNQVYERPQFKESTTPMQCTTRIQIESKEINDNVNKRNYRLNLYDTPELNSSTIGEISNLLRTVPFNQIVVMFTLNTPVDGNLKKLFGGSLKEWPGLITFAINKIGIHVSDGEIIDFNEKIKKTYGLKSIDLICIKNGDRIRNNEFKYLLHSEQDGYYFFDRNFLSIISQSEKVLIRDVPRKEKRREGLRSQDRPQSGATGGSGSNSRASRLNISTYGLIIIAGFVTVAIALAALIGTKTIQQEETTYSLGGYFFFFMLVLMLYSYQLARKIQSQIGFNGSGLENGVADHMPLVPRKKKDDKSRR